MPMIILDLPKANLGPAYADLQNHDNIRYKLYLQGYHKFCNHHWRPQEIRRVTNDNYKGQNTGVFFHGPQGSGKS